MVSRGVAGLFLDPGLGKTSITLAAFKILKNKGICDSMLVVAPLLVAQNSWTGEVEKWENFKDIKIQVLHGRFKEDRLRTKSDVYVINPEGLPWLLTEDNWRFLKCDMLVIDESTRFKKSNTQRFKLLKKWLDKFPRRYILTGTPAPNGLMDLFGQLYILDRGDSLGKYITKFRNDFFTQSGYQGYSWTPKSDAEDRIIQRTSHMILRLKAEDWLEMPELIGIAEHGADPNLVEVELEEEVRKKYNQMEELFVAEFNDEDVTAMGAAAASTKLRQIAAGAVYTNDDSTEDWVEIHDGKIKALQELIASLEGKSCLVFYQFRHDAERILLSIPQAVNITSTNAARSKELVAGFNSGSIPVLIGHPASAGHGLNLQGTSNHVIYFGVPWDLEHHDQSYRRVYRQGNPNTHIFIHYIVAKDTMDGVIIKALQGKDRTQKGLLNALKEAYQRD
tara:strand:- start:1655 stop:3001 length:1347 start_codon:yes stop_codon:yes gene_type:complete